MFKDVDYQELKVQYNRLLDGKSVANTLEHKINSMNLIKRGNTDSLVLFEKST